MSHVESDAHAHEQTKYANSQSAGQFRACRSCAERLSLTPMSVRLISKGFARAHIPSNRMHKSFYLLLAQ